MSSWEREATWWRDDFKQGWDGLMDGWTDGQTGGQKGGWVDGWMNAEPERDGFVDLRKTTDYIGAWVFSIRYSESF